MKTYLLNPALAKQTRYIREGRCMQKASSWVTAWPPITLATLTAIAKKKGEVRFVDGNVEQWTMTDFLEDLRSYQPDWVVVNTGFPSIDEDMEVARSIKETFPAVKILAFGVYFTLLEKQALENYPFLDFGLVGEPEETFGELLKALDEKKEDYSQIRGLAYRNGGGIVLTPPRPFIQDLDHLPCPDRDLLKNDRYRLPHNGKTYTLINIARGCPYPCTYCIVTPYYGRKIRKHSLDYVLQEILECVNRYGIEEFLFWEEVFTLDRVFAMDICEALLRHNLSIRWAATTRVGLLDEELLHMMKKAGCYLLGLGIESGNQEILDKAKKKQTLAEIRRAVEMCKKAGIQTMGHFIFGLPGETAETAEHTIRFMIDLGLDYMQCYSAVPYPKTEFGEMAREKGWVQAERWSQYDFGGPSIVDMGSITPEGVTHYRRQAFRRFYGRPAYLLKRLKEFSFFQLWRMLKFTDWIRPKVK